MAKRIVLCSDGTWNRWHEPHASNVVRLHRALARIPGEQVLEYDSGVGTGFFKLTGGAFGVGVSANIRQLYRFLVRHYEPGDSVYLFGFSRGAFTVRSLGGLLGRCGILRREHEARVGKAFDLYRSGRSAAARRFLRKFSHPTYAVRVIGVWDTVGALGVPFGLLNRLNPFSHRFHDTRLGPHVRHGFHALAIDEHRALFRPTLWNDRPRGAFYESRGCQGVCSQVWFAGNHSDIGGGYPERGLSDITLRWMIRQLRCHAPELVFRPEREWGFALAPDPLGPIHDERRHVYRLWRKHHRGMRPGALVHGSVHQRVQQAHPPYSPPNLPESVAWVAPGCLSPDGEAQLARFPVPG